MHRHGHAKVGAKTPTYIAWANMHARCRRPDYIARGITVCDRWSSFENFLADMGERPDGLELDRENNDGGYEPSNCRWTTETTQSRNRRGRRMVVFQGEEMTLAEAIERSGLPARRVKKRLYEQGWSTDRALAT